MARGHNPRRTNGHRRNTLRNRVKSWGLECSVCGKPIDYSLPAGDDWSFEVDEIKPVRDGGSPYDIKNVQPVHRICNRLKYQAEKKGEKTIQKPVMASKKW